MKREQCNWEMSLSHDAWGKKPVLSKFNNYKILKISDEIKIGIFGIGGRSRTVTLLPEGLKEAVDIEVTEMTSLELSKTIGYITKISNAEHAAKKMIRHKHVGVREMGLDTQSMASHLRALVFIKTRISLPD